MFSRILSVLGIPKAIGDINGASWLEKFIREATSQTNGSGVSSTKIVWLSNGMLSCYCATLATVGGVGVYVFLQLADGVYWAAVGALWLNALGFANNAKKHQTQVTKEIVLASQQTEKQRTEN